MIKYIIVDDEHIAHDIIKGYADALPNLQLVQHCYDAIEAMECLRSNPVDLIFLDLNMPKLKGFEFLKTLQTPPKIIVTTAYQEFALEGYELNVVDYLLKPFPFERFIKAINKVEAPTSAAQPATVSKKEERLFLKSQGKHVQVSIADILFIEATGNYIKVITSDAEIQVRETLAEFLSLLPQDTFVQVHKSFIVAHQHIKIIEGNQLFLQDHIIPIGKTYRKNLGFLRG